MLKTCSAFIRGARCENPPTEPLFVDWVDDINKATNVSGFEVTIQDDGNGPEAGLCDEHLEMTGEI